MFHITKLASNFCIRLSDGAVLRWKSKFFGYCSINFKFCIILYNQFKIHISIVVLLLFGFSAFGWLDVHNLNQENQCFILGSNKYQCYKNIEIIKILTEPIVLMQSSSLVCSFQAATWTSRPAPLFSTNLWNLAVFGEWKLLLNLVT